MERRFEGILANPLWLVLIVAVAIGLPVLALGEIAGADARSRLAQAEAETANLSVEAAADIISARVATLKAQVLAYTKSTTTAPTRLMLAVQSVDLPALQSELQVFRALIEPELPAGATRSVSWFVLDPSGRVLAALPYSANTIGVDLSARPYGAASVVSEAEPVNLTAAFASIATPGGAASQSGGGIGLAFVAVVGRIALPSTGQPLGLLVVNLNVQSLGVTNGLLYPFEDIYVVDQHGLLLGRGSRPVNADDAVFRDLSADPLVAAVLRGRVVGRAFDDPFGHGPRSATAASVERLGWHVIAVARPSAASIELEAALAQQRGVRLVLVALLLVATYLLSTSIRHSVRQRRSLGEANIRIEQANAAKSQFLANMSHELRTPLNAIIGFADVLGQKMFGELNAKQTEYVGDIVGSGRHLLSLINDILDLAKVEAGRMLLEPTTFSLREALGTGVAMVRERAAAHGIALSLEVAPDVDVITADERKVKQIMFNLLSNAVKFTPDGGTVTVSATRTADEVQVAVRDSGVGIAPGDQAALFNEFAQTDDGRRAAEGTGLGLALTKRLVELHGGRIWVESQVGSGSTFTFALQLQTERPAS